MIYVTTSVINYVLPRWRMDRHTPSYVSLMRHWPRVPAACDCTLSAASRCLCGFVMQLLYPLTLYPSDVTTDDAA